LGHGIVIDNGAAAAELRMLADGRLEASTSATWASVVQFAAKHGRMLPVLTNEPSTTIGGTLAVGGYGERSVAGRGQVDTVVRAHLIAPDGRASWHSRDVDADRFRYSLSSLGQLGFVSCVVLETEPSCGRLRLYVTETTSLSDLIAAATWLEDDAAEAVVSFSGQHYDGTFIASYTFVSSTPPVPAFVHRAIRRPRDRPRELPSPKWQLRSIGATRRHTWRPDRVHLWGDYVVAVEFARDFARFLERRVLEGEVYRRFDGRLLLLALRHPEKAAAFPFGPVAPSMRRLAFGFGVYLEVPRRDVGGITAARGLHELILGECLAFGGRPYLAGCVSVDPHMRSGVYGDAYRRLKEMRHVSDPADLFNPTSAL
jgi:FAD/FMN-containing dehydrogenase